MDWTRAPQDRDQIVLFPTRLDEAVGANHVVRLLDDILQRLDWSKWESAYVLRQGRPPIHPRVLAGVVLYGLLKRIRATRALEEALEVRLDFRWLAEGRSIDHTTLSKFRRQHTEALKDLFVQIGLVARELGCLPLVTLAFDGTRVRANNRRSGTRTPERLRELQQELAAKFAELEAQVQAADSEDQERFGSESDHTLSEELTEIGRRREEIEAALAELERLEQNQETIPGRIPLTDPQSRVMPNKEGGFAPNYTPLATVDVESGLIVSVDVISNTDEDKHLLAAMDDVREQFGLTDPPPNLLADGMSATGENIAACEERGINLYSPLPGRADGDNPALRADPSTPVAPQDRARLPVKTTSRKGVQFKQLEKQAFVYDADKDCYWCPEGKSLPYTNTTSESGRGQRRERRRYKSDPQDCAACPLRTLCLQGAAQRRTISREQYESHRDRHAEKMRTDAAREQYSRRRHAGERPFAVIKHEFGARRFLLRGLANVRQEWRWLATAFNLSRLFGLIAAGTGPPPAVR